MESYKMIDDLIKKGNSMQVHEIIYLNTLNKILKIAFNICFH